MEASDRRPSRPATESGHEKHPERELVRATTTSQAWQTGKQLCDLLDELENESTQWTPRFAVSQPLTLDLAGQLQ